MILKINTSNCEVERHTIASLVSFGILETQSVIKLLFLIAFTEVGCCYS